MLHHVHNRAKDFTRKIDRHAKCIIQFIILHVTVGFRVVEEHQEMPTDRTCLMPYLCDACWFDTNLQSNSSVAIYFIEAE
mmetsp:Transcript_31357/g.81704  ORF Transcript_31357/g.81704 Transcript_31357/m.81704 type:complete len:80 (+) Transcript_31357:83-322(+)